MHLLTEIWKLILDRVGDPLGSMVARLFYILFC